MNEEGQQLVRCWPLVDGLLRGVSGHTAHAPWLVLPCPLAIGLRSESERDVVVHVIEAAASAARCSVLRLGIRVVMVARLWLGVALF
jgi:hypothetical protein